MGTLTMFAAAAHVRWLTVLEAEKAANQIAPGNRLIPMKEVARRLGCSVQTVLRGSKAGRYPFVIRDGGRVVGSESALERWIELRSKRRSLR
jgi:predicted DNA-binding transcriptional regulator AlpA